MFRTTRDCYCIFKKKNQLFSHKFHLFRLIPSVMFVCFVGLFKLTVVFGLCTCLYKLVLLFHLPRTINEI